MLDNTWQENRLKINVIGKSRRHFFHIPINFRAEVLKIITYHSGKKEILFKFILGLLGHSYNIYKDYPICTNQPKNLLEFPLQKQNGISTKSYLAQRILFLFLLFNTIDL